MKSTENILDKIYELLGSDISNVNIIEEQIDTELQSEYYKHSRKNKKKESPETVLKSKNKIFDDNTSDEDKKTILTQLASINSIEAFRTIEKFLSENHKSLHKWAILALHESKLLIESKLLDENKVLITTGLGGKGLKLRYFVVLFTKDFSDINSIQKKIIKNEVEYVLNNCGAELEEIQFNEFFTCFVTIIPLQVNIQETFDKLIVSVNQFGNFLDENFIITNIKKLSFEEIKEFIVEHVQI